RAGERADLGVDVRRGHFERGADGDEIADLGEERARLARIDRLAATLAEPAVDARLECVALLEQRSVARTELADDSVEQRPDFRGIDAGPGRDLVAHEIVDLLRDLDTAVCYIVRHVGPVFFASSNVPSRIAGRSRRWQRRAGSVWRATLRVASQSSTKTARLRAQSTRPNQEELASLRDVETNPVLVRHFRQTVLWPLLLVPQKETSKLQRHWETLGSIERDNAWRELIEEFQCDPQDFRERSYREFVTFLPFVQRFLYGSKVGIDPARREGEPSLRIYRRGDIRKVVITYSDGSSLTFNVG